MQSQDFLRWLNEKNSREKFREYMEITYGKMDWRQAVNELAFQMCTLSAQLEELKEQLGESYHDQAMDI